MSRLEHVRDEISDLLPQKSWISNKSIAVLLPCYNEEKAIAKVVKDFHAALPSAQIYVYDNNSTDNTKHVAEAAGAIVRSEPLQGKGNVVRRMLADIDADIYLLADGDGTYDPASAGQLIEQLVVGNLDMVVGTRLGKEGAYRKGHESGNKLFNKIVAHLFGQGFTDILSGYRVLSKRFAKSFPAASSGFEIETELSIHALDLRLATAEIALPYKARIDGTESKLKTYRDGMRIMWTILQLYKELKPLSFFVCLGLMLSLIAASLGLPIFIEYIYTGQLSSIFMTVLSLSILQIGFISAVTGLILSSISHGRREFKRMHFLKLQAISELGTKADNL